MKLKIEPGIYVVAVSGGVDSMSLLNMLSNYRGVRLVVAHLDHGIREDSEQDRLLVQQAAERYRLPFVFDEAGLGQGASEDQARQARYDFLERVRLATAAKAIVTAHHQDDALETAIHNILRGTGRKGLSSMYDNPGVIRPLLNYTKAELINYARANGLEWRDDPTNNDQTYTRNYIRHQLIPRMTKDQRLQLLEHIKTGQIRNQLIDQLIGQAAAGDELNRSWFVGLPHGVAREVMASWLRHHDVKQFDRRLVEQLVQSAKTLAPGKLANVTKGLKMKVTTSKLALTKAER